MNKYTIIIIDGLSYLYKFYYAIPLLTNKKGFPTGAIYGMVNMLINILIQYSPMYMCVVFDGKGKNFRHEIFNKYKCNRQIMPDKLQIQLSYLFKILKALGIMTLCINNTEADDVIGSLSVQLNYKIKKLIFTFDKDMLQLTSLNTIIFNSLNKKNITIEDIKLKFGVSSPKYIKDYLSLVGDKTDCIPGVPGIGDKTAKILLIKFNNLKYLYSNLNKLDFLNLKKKEKITKILIQNHDLAFISYKLATIKTDLYLNVTFDDLKLKRPHLKKLIKLFKYLEFNKLLNEIYSKKHLIFF